MQTSHKTEPVKFEFTSQYESNPVVAELIEASNDGFWDWNIQTGEVYFSRRWAEMLGYKQNEIVPNVSSWERLVHPDDMAHVMSVLQNHLSGLTDHYETEHRVLTKSGEWKWILDRGRVISRAPDGTPLRAAGSHIDISDRKLHERERLKNIDIEKKSKYDLMVLNTKLQDSQQIFQDTFDLAAIGIAHMDSRFRWLKVNKTLSKMTGYDLDELTNMTLDDLTYPNDREKDRDQIPLLIKGSIPKFSSEKRFIKKNGDLIWINLSVSSKKDKNDSFEYFICCIDDVTSRKEFEIELEKSQAILKTIMNSTTDLIYVKDNASRFIAANMAVAQTISKIHQSLTPADLIGKNDIDFFDKAGEEIIKNDLSLMRNRREISVEEFVPTPKGTIIFHSVKTPMYNNKGDVIGIVGISRDITERKKMDQKLQETLKLRREFLSIASHELKTPLTSLLLLVQTMKKNLEGEDVSKLISKMVKATNQTEKQILRLNRLVDDMLDISRIESGRLILNKEKFELSDLLTETTERLMPQIEFSSDNAFYIKKLDQSWGLWDRHRIEQVITNLITNAIKYGRGKQIEISLEDSQDHAILSVKDFGLGIKKEDQTKIFDCFERATNTEGISGLGLGLFISKQIIDSHHGSIWVESEFGKGSTFYVKLPKNIKE